MKKRILMIIVVIVLIFNFLGSIELQFEKSLMTGGAPKSVEISPDGKYAYVCNLEGSSVWIYDVQKKKCIKKIQFQRTPGTGYDYKNKKEIPSVEEKPVEIGFTRGGAQVWISLHNGGDVVVYDTLEISVPDTVKRRKVKIYDIAKGTNKTVYLRSIPVGKTPKITVGSPDSKWVYVANWHSDDVTIIDAIDYKPIKNIPVIHIPRGIVFTSDSKYAYIANMGDLIVTKVDVENNHKKVKNIRVGLNPRHIRLSPDERYLYATLNIPGEFVKLNLSSAKIEKTIKVGERPRGFVLSKDGKYAFIELYNDDSLAIVQTDSMKVKNKIKVGHKPIGIAITPDGKELWLTDYYTNTLEIYTIKKGEEK